MCGDCCRPVAPQAHRDRVWVTTACRSPGGPACRVRSAGSGHGMTSAGEAGSRLPQCQGGPAAVPSATVISCRTVRPARSRPALCGAARLSTVCADGPQTAKPRLPPLTSGDGPSRRSPPYSTRTRRASTTARPWRCGPRDRKVAVDNPVAAPPRVPCCGPPAGGAHPRVVQAPGALPLPVGRASAGDPEGPRSVLAPPAGPRGKLGCRQGAERPRDVAAVFLPGRVARAPRGGALGFIRPACRLHMDDFRRVGRQDHGALNTF